MRYFGILLFFITSSALSASPSALLFAFPQKALVADSDTVVTKLADTTAVLVRKNSLSAGVNYGSDALFFGRTGPYRYPFVSGDMVINYKSGFFVYGSALKVLGYKPVVDEIDVGGGYYYRFSKKFTGTISYTRFFFNDDSQIIKSASSNDINLKNSYDWGLLKTSLIGDYLFGKSYDIFATVSNSRYWESSWSIFDDQDYLSINPSFNFILGTQNFVQRYSIDHKYRLEANNIYIKNENGLGARDNAKFTMLNYSFKIPISYNRPHYTLEFSYKYSIPVNVEGALLNRRESFYNLTFYYVFY
ncbi:hypothetical protein A0256_07250 [Mucilaginibacter sp. PAMC 26640]|nr:hypothetical protein A0256_07250 [Mucilaginibacter sp. PAMC 26640]